MPDSPLHMMVLSPSPLPPSSFCQVSLNDVFYNNCPISRALIGWFLSLIRGQTDQIWKLGLARTALCKWATCTRQTCLSKTLFIPGIWPVSGLVIVKNKLTVIFESLLLLKISYFITLSKFSIYHQKSDLHTLLYANELLDNVMMQYIINKRTDA